MLSLDRPLSFPNNRLTTVLHPPYVNTPQHDPTPSQEACRQALLWIPTILHPSKVKIFSPVAEFHFQKLMRNFHVTSYPEKVGQFFTDKQRNKWLWNCLFIHVICLHEWCLWTQMDTNSLQRKKGIPSARVNWCSDCGKWRLYGMSDGGRGMWQWLGYHGRNRSVPYWSGKGEQTRGRDGTAGVRKDSTAQTGQNVKISHLSLWFS